jgi:hypothetical protein
MVSVTIDRVWIGNRIYCIPILLVTMTVSLNYTHTVTRALQQVFLIFTNCGLLVVSTEVPRPSSFPLLTTATLNQRHRRQYYDWWSVLVLAPKPDFSLVWRLFESWSGVSFLTGRICNLQWGNSLVSRAGPIIILYSLIWGSPNPEVVQVHGPVIPPGIMFPFCRLLRLTGLWWRYSNPPPHRLLSTNEVQVEVK